MVSFLAGLCDICDSASPLATPEQVRAAGLDLDAAVCVECLARVNPTVLDRSEALAFSTRESS